jgi:hypothetical protein
MESRDMHTDKLGPTADPGHPQPRAAEVESAHQLAARARKELCARGLTDREIGRLADEYIALHLGEGVPEFIEWASRRRSA